MTTAVDNVSLYGLVALFAVVALGAVVPVVPTGAAVSAAGVYAWHEHSLVVVLVIAAGGLGAYLGDLVVFAACRRGGKAIARRFGWLREEAHLAVVQGRLEKNPLPVLLVSRLLPGGRIPVLLAAAFLDLDPRAFLVANAPACALWATFYAAIGILGGNVFDEPWEGALAAVVVIVVVTQIVSLVQRRRRPVPGPPGS